VEAFMGLQRAGQAIAFDSGSSPVDAYLSVPASGLGPGVVVVQEWWGLVDQIRDVCDRLAREGFVALAPDLYRGDRTTDPDEAGRLMMDLDIPRAVGDLGAAVSTLLNQATVTGARVGCVGFCMGGQLALAAACEENRLGAVVDCYGIHPNVELEANKIQAAVLGIFAENDGFIPLETARALESQLQAAGVRASFKTYLGVSHAFMNDARPEVYDASMASDAWHDILAFLRAELG
jgi:carboxymethylenebutenolidase